MKVPGGTKLGRLELAPEDTAQGVHGWVQFRHFSPYFKSDPKIPPF
jgi:hypothetical protein